MSKDNFIRMVVTMETICNSLEGERCIFLQLVSIRNASISHIVTSWCERERVCVRPHISCGCGSERASA